MVVIHWQNLISWHPGLFSVRTKLSYSHTKIAEAVREVLDVQPTTTLTRISVDLGIDRHTIEKAVRGILGESFRQYRQRRLLISAQKMLVADGTRSVKEIAYTLGFGSLRSFERVIMRAFQMTPSQLRSDANTASSIAGTHLRFAHLVQARSIGSRVRHLRLEVTDGCEFSFESGQFIAVVGKIEAKQTIALYSIASAPQVPRTRVFELCVRTSGGCVSSLLGKLSVRDVIKFYGPFGLFTLRRPLDPVLVFIATGVGIASVRSMLHSLFTAGRHDTSRSIRKVFLFWGVHSEDDMLYQDEFKLMALKQSMFHFIPIVALPSPQWKGSRGMVQEHLQKFLRPKLPLRAYVCGQPEMVRDVKYEFDKMGYSPEVVVDDLSL